MTKNPLFSLILLVLIGVVPTAHAQVENVYESEKIADEDVTVDLEAETIPEDGFLFGIENAWFRIRRAFTFQAGKKAEIDAQRLHQLDRKMAACVEVGSQQCVERIEELQEKAEDRAETYLERKQDVLENHRQRFEEWRQRRHDRINSIRSNLQDRVENKEELLQEREERREEIIQRRQEHMQEIRENHRNSAETRQQNREHLIETRSQPLKDRLDETIDRVNQRPQVEL